MRLFGSIPFFAVAAALGCSGGDDRVIESEVEALIGEPGRLSDIAELRLVERGRASILHLETGLYTADPPARRRIIRALEKIGDREALPILEHIARRDPDAEVRERAALAARTLGSEGKN